MAGRLIDNPRYAGEMLEKQFLLTCPNVKYSLSYQRFRAGQGCFFNMTGCSRVVIVRMLPQYLGHDWLGCGR